MALDLCVVGCGSFARDFAKAMVPLHGEVDLLFASRDAARAAEFNREFRGKGAFGSYAEAAADPCVDAMYICTPHHLHREHVELAASAGKHVLVEKPIARNLDEARATIAAAAANDVNLMVAENYRFLSGVRLAKRLAEDGSIGTLRMVQMQEEALFQPGQWRNNRELNGGGVFIDGGIHKVDGLLYLAGRPATVFAVEVPPGNAGLEAEDGLAMITVHSTGVVGLINHTWTCATPTPTWLSVLGTGGALYYEAGRPWLRWDQGKTTTTIALEPDGFGIVPMVREFKSSIEEGREPEMSGSAGMEDLELVLKAYDSVESRQSVSLL